MKRLVALVGAVAVAAALATPILAAPTAAQSQYGYPWRGNLPVRLTIKDHTDASWRALMEQAVADYSLSPVIDVTLTTSDHACSVQGSLTACSGSWEGLRESWTVYTARNGYMTDAAIYINDFYLHGYFNSDGVWFPPYTTAQLGHLVCHEVGAALGILTDRTCSDAQGWHDHPTQADYDQLLDIYGG